MTKNSKIIIAGVGGQGVVFLTEILVDAGLDGQSDISDVTSSPVIKAWMTAECEECAEKLVAVNQTLNAYFSQFEDKKSMPRNVRITQIILKQLLRKIEGYIAKQSIS